MINYVSSLRLSGAIALTFLLGSCASPDVSLRLDPGKMADERPISEQVSDDYEEAPAAQTGFNRLNSLMTSRTATQRSADLANNFAANDSHQIALNQLPLPDFIQLVFGQSLAINYVIAENIRSPQPVSLNVSEPISSRELFRIAAQTLEKQNLSITLRDNVYFIHPRDNKTRNDVIIGFGRAAQDVPDTHLPILQIAPLRFGAKLSLERTLRALSGATITMDNEQNAAFIEGSRAEIIRTLDLINLLDIPSTRGRFIGLTELVYVTPDDFIKQLTELLQAEGITANTRAAQGGALLMVPISQLGAVALFAGDEFVLDRAEYWARQLDKPAKGDQKQFFLYHPRYARAADLGASLQPLLGNVNTSAQGNQARDTRTAQAQQLVQALAGGDLRLNVDERSNTLMFYGNGASYAALRPIINRLDTMPKQILLDAVIAEVTLTDEFSMGFEFAIRNVLSGEGRSINFGTLGALGVSEMSGLKITGIGSAKQFVAALSASTNLVNVLSNPTLVVRDGVAASITVGNDIPTIGSTTTNPNFDTQTINVVYRKTGVNLNVQPNINAQGLVVLQIDKQISNIASGGPSVQGSPSIFERNIKTEVIATSGQTILLGGLISENNTSGNSYVPGFASIPLLGKLFQGENKQKQKTELVIFITPRIIDTVDDWYQIRKKFAEGLTSLTLDE
ncbi:hypothetical protein GCM10010919_17230 [Alishewanella longhuensis]|uniref:General secretion pathway protein GspD n=1 Tax=Alishewanella longhuensis TaxID=1091037 RepID=A0ABQ3L0A8_9ALTE|nr:secretin N-terminal domain-containing protein [Alishewanella longhuensis]GHG68073.1 hypothetical protein GCM10010919_17230 [Alishewanella longhuensis]